MKAWVYPYKFCSYFSSCGFVYHARSWTQLWTSAVHYHFCFSKVQAAALNPRSVFKILHTDSLVFAAVEGRKTYSPEGFKGAFHLGLPFWGHLNIYLCFPFHFKCQRINFSILQMKTRPWKFVGSGRNMPSLPALFERVILRQKKNVFLGPLKSPKNMLRKSILIGLFALNNNRTIGEPKCLHGG